MAVDMFLKIDHPENVQALEFAVLPEREPRIVAYMGYHGEWLDWIGA